MPTPNATPAAAVQPLDPDTAYAVLSQRVYAPAFFEKLASDFRLAPKNEAEALDMLAMASQLRQAYDSEQEKRANASTSVLAQAKNHLNSELEKRGFQIPRSQSNAIKLAAANAARDPQLAHAVLSFHAQQQAAA